jgi:hypothetical protein
MPVGWSFKGPALVCAATGFSSGYQRLTIPVAPEGGYELQVKFMISRSHGKILIHLPARGGSVMLEVDADGPSGLSYIDQKSLYSNGTGTTTTLGINKVYTVDVKVALTGDRANIAADLDGRPLVRWQGPQAQLSPSPSSMDKRYFGLLAYYTTATFGSVCLRPLDGEAKVLRPAAADTSSKK